MVDRIQSLFTGDIEPQTVDEVNIFRLHGGRVRSDAVGVDRLVRMYHLKNKLLFGLGHRFPGFAQFESLLWPCHLAGKT